MPVAEKIVCVREAHLVFLKPQDLPRLTGPGNIQADTCDDLGGPLDKLSVGSEYAAR